MPTSRYYISRSTQILFNVAGSHVIIRHQAGKKFPNPVIERAAQLAAYYSKRKTDSLCPVIFAVVGVSSPTTRAKAILIRILLTPASSVRTPKTAGNSIKSLIYNVLNRSKSSRQEI